jgi:4-diphosphocytidyl-2-C-methyl-D-erythritol kinase
LDCKVKILHTIWTVLNDVFYPSSILFFPSIFIVFKSPSFFLSGKVPPSFIDFTGRKYKKLQQRSAISTNMCIFGLNFQANMICFPNAKINLGLYVTAQRPDGYHDLETVFLPIPLQDVLEIKPLGSRHQNYEWQQAGSPLDGSPEDNLVVRVYQELKREFQLPPISIYLYKRIPTGAGLGGGSSDAAFMMRLLCEQFDLHLHEEDMERRLSHIGADCAFFVRNKPALATGIGDCLTPIDLDLSEKYLLLVKPPLSVSTRQAYAHVVPAPPPFCLTESLKLPLDTWRTHISNDFEKSIFSVYPQIEAIKQTLYDMHAIYAAMSGSGSAVYAILEHPFEEAPEIFKDCFVFQHRLKVYPATFS